jgi:hypothetical protein
LPFIFGSVGTEDDSGPSSRPNGRRTFNKKGEETSLRGEQPEEEANKLPAETDTSPPKGKMYARPSSISLSSSKNVMVPKKSKKQGEKSVFTSSRDAIFGFVPDAPPPDFLNADSTKKTSADQKDSATAGSSASISSASKISRSFMKPAGVDSPINASHSRPNTVKSEDSLSSGAQKEKKAKRSRLDSETGSKSDAPKKKKKKQHTEE